MRKPYSHEYERFVDKFRKTACYTHLTSRLLSADRGGNYYGPSEGQYTSSWQYQPRSKCRCHNKQLCDAIRQDLYVATTKSSCLIADRATAWYGQQKKLRELKQTMSSMTPKQLRDFQCRYYGNFQFQSPPPDCLDLKAPIRSVPCLSSYQVSSAKRISNEFRELLCQHDARQREKSVLHALPADYTRRRVKPASSKAPEKLPTCEDGRPCYCGSNLLPDKGVKSDTHMDRHRRQKKGFLAKWCFSSQDQVYPDEDNDYYCRQGSHRSLLHYARSQPRIVVHEQCPPAACAQDTCPYRCKEPRKETTHAAKYTKPRAHGYTDEADTDAEQEIERLGNATDLKPRLRPTTANSVHEIWTKPNAMQMRESRASLRPRYFVPKVARKHTEPPVGDKNKCVEKPKTPPKVPPKPRGYILGRWPETEMTKTAKKRPLKRKHPCLREEKLVADMTPRYRVNAEECVDIKEKPAEDKSCYPHLEPRFIPQGPRAARFDSKCWKRNRSPQEDPKPKRRSWPKTQPEFHDDKPTCAQLRRKQRYAQGNFAETRPRFHDLSSDASPQRYRKRRGIVRKPSKTNTSQQTSYQNRKKPNADETSDDTDRGQSRLPLSRPPSTLSCRVRGSQESRFVQLGKCQIPLRPPAAAKYKAPAHILKGHETCFKESNHWSGIPPNYPQSYLDKAKRNKRELELGKKLRLRMWATKECAKPKYAPASKCQTSLKVRCPSNEPHKALYMAKKRLSTRDASPYHRTCYKSSSGGESECTFLGRKLRR